MIETIWTNIYIIFIFSVTYISCCVVYMVLSQKQVDKF